MGNVTRAGVSDLPLSWTYHGETLYELLRVPQPQFPHLKPPVTGLPHCYPKRGTAPERAHRGVHQGPSSLRLSGVHPSTLLPRGPRSSLTLWGGQSSPAPALFLTLQPTIRKMTPGVRGRQCWLWLWTLTVMGREKQEPGHVLLVIESLSTADPSPSSGGSPHYPSATREVSPQYSCELNMQPNELILLVCKRIENSLSK